MKKNFLTVFVLVLHFVVTMANERDSVDLKSDSIVFSANLGELVVESDIVSNKADKQVILPTSMQKAASTNGVMLLKQLQIPNISVSPIDKSIKTAFGDDVQLRINGIEVSREEVQSVQPCDVIRVEYIENPGFRYRNAAAVINFVTKKKFSGGNISGEIQNSVSASRFDDYNMSGRVDFGKSSISAVASWEHRDLKWTRENEETFRFDGNVVENKEIGSPTKLKYDYVNVILNYNYVNDEKSVLNIAFKNRINKDSNSFTDRNSQLLQNGRVLSVVDREQSSLYIPSLDVYYQLNLKNDRHLYFDVVGTYLTSESTRRYSMTEQGEMISDFTLETEGEKFSVVGEAIYEQPLWNGMFTAGLKHFQSYMDNIYKSDVENKVGITSADTYIFAEYKGSLKKLNYILSLGVKRNYYRQSDRKQDDYILQPSLTLSYNIRKNLFVKYNVYTSGYAPSLSDLSDVTQEMDMYQVRRGNPDLNNVRFVSNSLNVSWRNKFINIDLSGRYSYDSKPFMEETVLEGERVVRTVANQKGFHRINLQSTIQIRPCKDNISISLTPFFNRYISLGNNYTHTHSNWGMRGNIIGMYKNWLLMAEMNTSYHTLWGETIGTDEAVHSVALGYNRDKWSVQAMVVNPFTSVYKRRVENVSMVAPYRQIAFSEDFSRMFVVNVSFNLDFGRQRKGYNKRISNSDTDTGIMRSTK